MGDSPLMLEILISWPAQLGLSMCHQPPEGSRPSATLTEVFTPEAWPLLPLFSETVYSNSGREELAIAQKPTGRSVIVRRLALKRKLSS